MRTVATLKTRFILLQFAGLCILLYTLRLIFEDQPTSTVPRRIAAFRDGHVMFRPILGTGARACTMDLSVNETFSAIIASELQQVHSSLVEDNPHSSIFPGDEPPTRKFAVIGCTLPTRTVRTDRTAYLFILPLTVLAWRRIGFQTIIMFFDQVEEWERTLNSSLIFRYVLQQISTVGGLVHFVPCSGPYAVTLSQVGRVYAPALLHGCIHDDDYLLTSDADLWPIDGQYFHPRKDVNITVLNAFCCGRFKHRNRTYYMHPMVNIGATARVWRDLVRSSSTVSDSTSLLKYLAQEFATEMQETSKVNGKAWYLDQKLVSMKVKDFEERYGNKSMAYVTRKKGRLDKRNWKPEGNDVRNKTDAHVVNKLYIKHRLAVTFPLFKAMYGNVTLQYIHNYGKTFLKYFRAVPNHF